MGEAAPGLEPGADWLASRSPADRRRLGQWVTPWQLVRAVVAEVCSDLPVGATVMDPACGDGRWLLAAYRLRPDLRLIGVDIDPDAIAAARRTLSELPARELRCGDALSMPLPAVDQIVGNPPFVRPQNLDEAVRRDLWARFETMTDKADLYAAMVERALSASRRVALVLPDSWLHMASFAALRDLVLRSSVDGVFAVSSFPGIAVKTVVLVVDPRARRRTGVIEDGELKLLGRLAISAEAWSLSGPLPLLEGRPLGRWASLSMGVVCGEYARYVHPAPRTTPEDRPTCRGRDVSRWKIAAIREFIWYMPRDMLSRKPYVAPKSAEVFDVAEKIILAGTSGTTLRAAMDTERRFPLDSCYILRPSPGVDPWALLGFLLSSPVGAWYGARHRGARVKGVEVARIPLPDTDWSRVAAAARAQDDAGLDAAVEQAYTR